MASTWTQRPPHSTGWASTTVCSSGAVTTAPWGNDHHQDGEKQGSQEHVNLLATHAHRSVVGDIGRRSRSLPSLPIPRTVIRREILDSTALLNALDPRGRVEPLGDKLREVHPRGLAYDLREIVRAAAASAQFGSVRADDPVERL